VEFQCIVSMQERHDGVAEVEDAIQRKNKLDCQ